MIDQALTANGGDVVRTTDGLPDGTVVRNRLGDLFLMVRGVPHEMVANGPLDMPSWGPFTVLAPANDDAKPLEDDPRVDLAQAVRTAALGVGNAADTDGGDRAEHSIGVGRHGVLRSARRDDD